MVSASRVKHYQTHIPSSQRASAFMVSPALLEIAAGEFKGLLADYLLLKASAFLGGRYQTTDSDREAVYTLFRQSLALDPYFFQTCYYIQGYLPWEGKMPKKAIELLEICKKHRYWDWNPCFFIGFDYFYFLHDHLAASKYLMEGSKRPDAPLLLGMLAARLAQKGGQTEAAIVFLKSMYDTTDNQDTKKQIKQRIDALTGVLILEKGIAQFKGRFGRPPKKLEELVTAEILEKLPHNPYQTPYTYENGQIGF
jgi:hypothetical protein